MDLLRQLWHRWQAFGHFMGNMLARVVLSLFYFTIFVPFAIGARLFTDPLAIKDRPTPLWVARRPQDPSLTDAGRQF